MGFGVWGLGFGVWGLGFGVWGLGLRLGSCSSIGLQGLQKVYIEIIRGHKRVPPSIPEQRLRSYHLGFRVQDVGLRV